MKEMWNNTLLLLRSNQPCESSLHSRENRGETSTSSHQSHQKKKKRRNKAKKGEEKEEKDKQTTGTAEVPMIIEDDDQSEE